MEVSWPQVQAHPSPGTEDSSFHCNIFWFKISQSSETVQSILTISE